MNNNNNIEDWYRNELDNFNVQPDKNAWDKVANKLNEDDLILDEQIEQWYKNELNNKAQQPDVEVWSKLSTKLDTASVWERLSVSLIRYNRFVWWRNILLKTAAIFLLIAGISVTYNNSSKNDNFSKNNISAKSNPLIASIAPVSNNQIENEKTNKETIVINPIKKTKTNTINTKNNTNKLLNEERIKAKNQPIINATNNLVINTTLFNNQLKQNNYAKEFLIKRKNDKIIFNNKRFTSNTAFGIYARRFYVGANVGLKKQNMITKINSSGALNNFSQQALLDFGVNLGATFGKIISDKFNVETNLNFYSTNGYRKKFNLADETFDERLNLTYSSASILAKRMYNKSTFDSKTYSTNILGGIYVSYLNASTSKINNQLIKNEGYSNIDMGLVLGIEQDRYITKTLVLTPGIRYHQGLKNVATTENAFAAAYNYTIEFNLGVKYIFLKKD